MTYISSEEKSKWFYWRILVVILVLFMIVISVFYFKNRFISNNFSDKYRAVFLTNGQVYFGNITSVDRKYMKLSNVYYLQVSGQENANVNEPQMKLIKLGTELHGPENEMYINQSNILFYEDLRVDSKIIESIKNYK